MESPTTYIYELRAKMVQIYAKHSFLVKWLLKFISAFLMLMVINIKNGYVTELVNLPAAMGISFFCGFLPWNVISLIMNIVLLLHFLKISVIVAAVALALLIVMILMNILFAPEWQGIVYFVPVAFFFRIPFLLPLVLGLAAPISAVIPMLSGIVIYFFMDYISSSAGILADATETAGMAARFTQLIDGMKDNQAMLLFAVAFVITVVLVSLIHRMSIDYAWVAAVTAGVVVDMLLLLLGTASADHAGLSVPYIVCSSLICGLIAYLVQLMMFNVDYKQTDYAQFEDDEYYYYVKAVPKVRVTEKEYDKITIQDDENRE